MAAYVRKYLLQKFVFFWSHTKMWENLFKGMEEIQDFLIIFFYLTAFDEYPDSINH